MATAAAVEVSAAGAAPTLDPQEEKRRRDEAVRATIMQKRATKPAVRCLGCGSLLRFRLTFGNSVLQVHALPSEPALHLELIS